MSNQYDKFLCFLSWTVERSFMVFVNCLIFAKVSIIAIVASVALLLFNKAPRK